MISQKHVFLGGLNTDDDFQLFPEGDYVDALNFRTGSSQNGREGAGETIWGTRKVTSYSRHNQDDLLPEVYTPVNPAGTECIGFIEDRANNCGYFFIYRPDDNHGIYRYNPATQTAYAIIESPVLKFQAGMRIDQSALFDHYNLQGEKNTFLAYTDGVNPPRLFNANLIEKTRWANVTDYWLNLEKAPPVAPLKVLVNYDNSITAANNELKPGVYQFAYRYLFTDGLRSTFSPISIPASVTKENIEAYAFNRISLYQQYYMYGLTEAEAADNDGLNDIPFGDPRLDYIDKIEIVYRYSDIDNWQLIYRGAMEDKPLPVYHLYRNTNEGTVAPAEVLQPYSAVPLKCQALAGMVNRVFCGNNEIDVPEVSNFVFEDEEVYVSQNGEPTATDFMAATDPLDFPNAPTLRTRNRFELNTFIDANYSVGIVFKNENGKRSPVITSPELRKRMWVVDETVNRVLIGQAAMGFRFGDFMVPPDWATSYEVVRTRASNLAFAFYAICNRYYFYQSSDTSPTGYVVSPSADASYFALDIYNFSTATGADFPRTKENDANDIYYTFQEGDEVMIGGLPGTFRIARMVNEKLLIPNSQLLRTEFGAQADANLAGAAISIMIRRPYETELPPVFYSVGEWYPVLNPKTENRSWSKSDWTYSGNADVTQQSAGGFTWYNKYPFRNGDAYKNRKRFTFDYDDVGLNPAANSLTISYSQMNPFTDRIAQEWERGDLWVDLTAPNNTIKQIDTQVSFGGQFIPDARVNNLNLFNGSDQFVYPAEYGAITELRPGQNQEVESAGAILVAGFVNETVAIYINRTTMANLNGSTEVLQSDRVLGSYNALVGSWGTKHPSGTACSDGRQYRIDIAKGVVHRYSRDGLTPISKLKMRRFFKNKCNDLTYGGARICAGYDYEHQEYVLTLKNILSPSEDITIAFNEDKNRWVTRYSFLPECYGSIGTLFLSFKNGELYHHNSLPDNENIFHDAEEADVSYVETVTNGLDAKLQSEVKEFENFIQESDAPWEPVWMRTQKPRNEPLQPETYAASDEISEEEYKFKGAVNKNIHTVNMDDADYARWNGDAMKGYWLHSRWQHTPQEDPVTFFAVNVGYNVSNPITARE